MSDTEPKTITSESKETSDAKGDQSLVLEEKKTHTLHETIMQLEKLYTEKEEALKEAQAILSKAESEALTVLRRLVPFRSGF